MVRQKLTVFFMVGLFFGVNFIFCLDSKSKLSPFAFFKNEMLSVSPMIKDEVVFRQTNVSDAVFKKNLRDASGFLEKLFSQIKIKGFATSQLSVYLTDAIAKLKAIQVEKTAASVQLPMFTDNKFIDSLFSKSSNFIASLQIQIGLGKDPLTKKLLDLLFCQSLLYSPSGKTLFRHAAYIFSDLEKIFRFERLKLLEPATSKVMTMIAARTVISSADIAMIEKKIEVLKANIQEQADDLVNKSKILEKLNQAESSAQALIDKVDFLSKYEFFLDAICYEEVGEILDYVQGANSLIKIQNPLKIKKKRFFNKAFASILSSHAAIQEKIENQIQVEQILDAENALNSTINESVEAQQNSSLKETGSQIISEEGQDLQPNVQSSKIDSLQESPSEFNISEEGSIQAEEQPFLQEQPQAQEPFESNSNFQDTATQDYDFSQPLQIDESGASFGKEEILSQPDSETSLEAPAQPSQQDYFMNNTEYRDQNSSSGRPVSKPSTPQKKVSFAGPISTKTYSPQKPATEVFGLEQTTSYLPQEEPVLPAEEVVSSEPFDSVQIQTHDTEVFPFEDLPQEAPLEPPFVENPLPLSETKSEANDDKITINETPPRQDETELAENTSFPSEAVEPEPKEVTLQETDPVSSEPNLGPVNESELPSEEPIVENQQKFEENEEFEPGLVEADQTEPVQDNVEAEEEQKQMPPVQEQSKNIVLNQKDEEVKSSNPSIEKPLVYEKNTQAKTNDNIDNVSAKKTEDLKNASVVLKKENSFSKSASEKKDLVSSFNPVTQISQKRDLEPEIKASSVPLVKNTVSQGVLAGSYLPRVKQLVIDEQKKIEPEVLPLKKDVVQPPQIAKSESKEPEPKKNEPKEIAQVEQNPSQKEIGTIPLVKKSQEKQDSSDPVKSDPVEEKKTIKEKLKSLKDKIKSKFTKKPTEEAVAKNEEKKDDLTPQSSDGDKKLAQNDPSPKVDEKKESTQVFSDQKGTSLENEVITEKGVEDEVSLVEKEDSSQRLPQSKAGKPSLLSRLKERMKKKNSNDDKPSFDPEPQSLDSLKKDADVEKTQTDSPKSEDAKQEIGIEPSLNVQTENSDIVPQKKPSKLKNFFNKIKNL